MPTYHLTIAIPKTLDQIIVSPVLLGRKIWYGYSFRRVPLTGGFYAIVDPEDYEHISQYKWYTKKNAPGKYYAARTAGSGRSKRCELMHRLIMQSEINSEFSILNSKFTNSPCELVVDHINRNGLDNRKANLRLATHTQNLWNSPRGKNKRKSKYKGLWWDKRSNKWLVVVSANGRRISCGFYADEEQAARAYDTAAAKYHGKYAYLNFPPPPKHTGLKSLFFRS